MHSVEDLGERRIIEIITRCLEKMPGTPVPIGDDVAAVDIGHGNVAILKTDMLVGKTDVPAGMSLRQAARKAVVMNVSDLAAKGVNPTAILASIGVSRDVLAENIEELGKGLNEGAREYGAYVVGGDTNEASDLIIACTAFGIGKEKEVIRRSGAKPDDIVATTGFFGKTASGLKILLEGLQTTQDVRNKLLESVFMPHARLKEGVALAQTRAVTASIDSSDGLAWSLHELSQASGVGFEINNLPIDPEAKTFAETYNLDPKELALYGGEEYELVFTVTPRFWKSVKEQMMNLGTRVTKIGFATQQDTLLLKSENRMVSIERRGWEHFKSL